MVASRLVRKISASYGSLLSLLVHPAYDASTPEGRGAERHRRLILTSLAAGLSKAISVGTLLISVPLTLHYLGAERYGMWGTLTSLMALLTFADFGIGNGLLNQVAAAHGQGDRGALRRYVSSAFFVLFLMAVVFGLAFAAIYTFVPWYKVFNVRSELAISEAAPTIAVFAACIALNLPLAVVQRLQMGIQQGYIAYLWNCAGSVLALVAVLAAVRMQAGLPWLVLAFLGAPLIVSALNGSLFFLACERDIAPRLSAISKGAMTSITQTGLLFVALQTVVAAAYGSDNLIIAHTLGAASVAEYAVPAQMFALVVTVLAVALGPLWPAYGEAISRQDNLWVRKALLGSLSLSMGFAFVCSMALLIAAPDILHLWIGQAVQPPFLLLLALAIWRVIEAGASAVTTYLNGANQLRFQLAVLSSAGLLAIILKVVLINAGGISGAAWGSILSYLAAAIPVTLFLRKQLATGKTSE